MPHRALLFPFLCVLSAGCSDDTQELDPQDVGARDLSIRPDSGPTDAGASDLGAPDLGTTDLGFVDGGAPSDGGPGVDVGADLGSPQPDAGSIPCNMRPRDDCLAAPGCVLHGSDQDGGYFCRDAANACELEKNAKGCDQAGMGNQGCGWSPDDCYCPEGQLCTCGGGPARICRQLCGGFIGGSCDPGYFCDYVPEGGPLCVGNADQGGACILIPPSCDGGFGQQVCGCSENQPVLYANDCERRRAGASFGALGACP